MKKGFYLSFGEYYPDETIQIVPDERLFLETDDSLLDIEDILCQAARVRGVEVEALREVIRRNIQNVFLGRKSCIFRERVVLLSHMELKYNKNQIIKE